jgi:WD40 repeat protein
MARAQSDPHRIYLGTKNGKVLLLELSEATSSEFLDLKLYDTKYPIFSLLATTSPSFSTATSSSDGRTITLFCGGGDRFISVAPQQQPFSSSPAAKDGAFKCIRLGPHTGWVKDLQYDSRNECLYSIGCNRIESWKAPSSGSGRNVLTRSIENSPQDGATLSSDLLCLLLVHDSNILLSGGVDGRIHIWSTSANDKYPEFSTRVHNGRVNRLALAPKSGRIFSIGHDGVICSLKIDASNYSDPIIVDCTYRIPDTPRLSSLAVLQELGPTVDLAVGTTDGKVYLVRVDIDGSTSDTTNTVIIGQDQIENEPMVNAIVGHKFTSSEASVLVGHASGLCLVSCKLS